MESLKTIFTYLGKKVLPLIHSKKVRAELLEKKTKKERYAFYNKKWNNNRWKILFKIFFSRAVMGNLEGIKLSLDM